MHIDLFIAPDGEFRHMTPEHRHSKAIVEPVFRPTRLLVVDLLPPEAIEVENKVFRRYRLMIPSTEIGETAIPTGPSQAWSNFRRHVISDLEAKGDAPWK